MAYPVATAPAPASAGFGASGALVRPIPGAKLTDTFGAARSGGRKHEGIDIFAPEGTPIERVVEVFQRSCALLEAEPLMAHAVATALSTSDPAIAERSSP